MWPTACNFPSAYWRIFCFAPLGQEQRGCWTSQSISGAGWFYPPGTRGTEEVLVSPHQIEVTATAWIHLRSSVCSRQETGKHPQQPREHFRDTHQSQQSRFCPEQREAQSSSGRAALPSRAGSGRRRRQLLSRGLAMKHHRRAGRASPASHPACSNAASNSRKAFAPLVHPDQSSRRCFAGGRIQKQELPPLPSAGARSTSSSRAWMREATSLERQHREWAGYESTAGDASRGKKKE